MDIKSITNVNELYSVLDQLYKGNLLNLISDLNETLTYEGKEYISEIFDQSELGVRICSHCQDLIINGFVIYDGSIKNFV